MDPPPRGLFARFGPKYRFSGRTQYQTQQATGGQGDRPTDVRRVIGRRFIGSKSMETGLSMCGETFCHLFIDWTEICPCVTQLLYDMVND